MKLQAQERMLMTSGEKSKFTVQANAKMFEILSSKIYSHKIAAIVREITCNAYDSHVEAGKVDVPFRVVVPNGLHPYFEVIDEGVGLDHEQVISIYTDYGNSTKTGSNAVIGAFGLGSKTPFAYSSTFSVVATKNGVQRYYNMFIDEMGEPSYSLIREVETDKPNGVKVQIPVKESDYYEFRYEAQFILSMFPVRPLVNDGFEFLFDNDFFESMDNEGYAIIPSGQSYSSLYNEELYAVMGNVCYPIPYSMYRGTKAETFCQRLSQHKKVMFVRFAIGELNVSASRESLSEDDPERLQMIRDRIVSAYEHQRTVFEAELAKKETLMEAYEYAKGADELLGFSSVKYKGRLIREVGKKNIPLPRGFNYQTVGRTFSSCPTVNWTRYFSLADMLKVEDVVVIYRDIDKYVAPISKFIKKLVSDPYNGQPFSVNKNTLFITVDGFDVCTPHKLQRIRSIIGKPFKAVLTYSELHNIYKAERAKRTGNTSGKRTVTEDTNIFAKAFVCRPFFNNVDEVSAQHWDVSDSEEIEFLYTDKTDSYYVNSDAMIASKYLNKRVVILVENKRSERKIRINNIRALKDVIELAKQDQEFVDFITLGNIFCLENGEVAVENDSRFNFWYGITEVESPIRDEIGEYIELFKSNDYTEMMLEHFNSGSCSRHNHTMFVDSAVVEEIQSLIDGLKAEMNKMFPLLENFSTYRLDSPENRLYIEQVLFYNANKNV